MNTPSKTPLQLFTIGHSNKTFEEFLKLLKAHSIGRIVDVRTVPKSRRVPWFNKEELAPALNQAGIRYAYLPELGGLRHPQKDSVNQGWKNETFRGFADYMQTLDFERVLEKLNAMLPDLKTAIMCAEAVPWRCHRSLIADAETARGVGVEHLLGITSVKQHQMTPFAVIGKKSNSLKVTYPAAISNNPELPGMPIKIKKEPQHPKRGNKPNDLFDPG